MIKAKCITCGNEWDLSLVGESSKASSEDITVCPDCEDAHYVMNGSDGGIVIKNCVTDNRGLLFDKHAHKPFILISDMIDLDDPEGRSYRQINNATPHKVAVGTLVELKTGVRLFVVKHNRDCDGTPLYCLSPDKDDTEEKRPGFANSSWVHGISDEGILVIEVLSSTPDCYGQYVPVSTVCIVCDCAGRCEMVFGPQNDPKLSKEE